MSEHNVEAHAACAFSDGERTNAQSVVEGQASQGAEIMSEKNETKAKLLILYYYINIILLLISTYRENGSQSYIQTTHPLWIPGPVP